MNPRIPGPNDVPGMTGAVAVVIISSHLLQDPLFITYATHSTAMELPPAKS